MDITGLKINLNSGGNPGIAVPVLQPTVLKSLVDEGGAQIKEKPQVAVIQGNQTMKMFQI
jgi:type VI secretion system secreted protein VgrG